MESAVTRTKRSAVWINRHALFPLLVPLSARRLPLFLGAASSLIVSCSPVQGYPGPHLPSEQVSFLEIDDSEQGKEFVLRITLDGIPFSSNGIEVLPGQHELDAFRERLGPKRNCIPEQRIDRSGYEACLWREQRERARRRGAWFPCSLSSYTTTVYHCLVKLTNSDCHFTLKTEAGKSYRIKLPKTQSAHEFSVPPLDQGATSGVFEMKEKTRVGDGECQEVRTYEEQREFSSPSS